MAINTFYYDQQIKRYLIQVMAIFNGLHVKVGKNDVREEDLVPVPIHYGSRDRTVQHILGGNTQNKPLRLPVMSAYMSGLEIDTSLMKGKATQISKTVLPRGGAVPTDLTVVHRYMPIPYRMRVEVALYCSNQEQQFQILEQILMLFDPSLQIQTTDADFDWTKITTVKLEGIRFEENYPPGIERRIIHSTLDFSLPIYIAPPTDLKKEIVNKIFYRINAIDYSSDVYEAIAELDQNNEMYELLVDIDKEINGDET